MAAQTPASGGEASSSRKSRERLTSREKQRLRDLYAEKGDPGLAEIAAELKIHRTTVKRNLEAEEAGPETPPEGSKTLLAAKRRRRGGRPRLCSQEHNETLRKAFKKDPTGGRTRAAQALARAGGPKISRFTLARELERRWTKAQGGIRKRPITRYVELSPQEMDMQFHHLEGLKTFLGDRAKFPKRYTRRLNRVYFQDETHYVPGTVARQGYGAEQINLNEKHGRHGSGEKINIWGVHGARGWVKARRRTICEYAHILTHFRGRRIRFG